MTDFIFLGSEITANSECNQEINKTPPPWKKRYDKLRVLKSRDITLLTKVHIVKAKVFSVVMYRCESWTIKKAEHKEFISSNCRAGEDS